MSIKGNNIKKGIELEIALLGKSEANALHPEYIAWDVLVKKVVKGDSIEPRTAFLKTLYSKGYKVYTDPTMDRYHGTDFILRKGNRVIGVDITINPNKRKSTRVIFNPHKDKINKLFKEFERNSFPILEENSKKSAGISAVKIMMATKGGMGRQAFQ